jgi:uncharacterized YccA/Bax inhibitor family protein
MASANPAFNNPAFQERSAIQSLNGQPVNGQVAGTTPQQNAAAVSAHLEGAYAAPPAGAIETGRMTVEDTVLKTLALFAVLVVTAVVGWVWTMSGVTVANPAPSMLPWMVGALGGFVLAMVVSFGSRTKVRPALIFAYAAFEGIFVGAISAFFEFLWPGIVLQATLATVAVVAVTLALFASGKVRATKRANKVFLIAMLGYLVFSMINVVMMMFGAFPAGSGGAFGILSNVHVLGIPLGLIIGVLVVIMAAYSLVQDFDFIQQGVRNGAPRQVGWLGGFGIMVTVVWLYIEILRILAIARSN